MDKRVSRILGQETVRQSDYIQLIASENFASEAVMQLSGSVFTNKYAEGYPGKRYYNGCDNMDDIEALAIHYATLAFDSNFANVQPHSGANANFAVMQGLLNHKDKVVAMDLSAGGHLSHGAPVNWSGNHYEFYHYGVNDEGFIDYDEVEALVKRWNPRMLIAGGSAYPRQIKWHVMRDIADTVGAYLLADMAHYSGLIAGGAYLNPLPHAHVVTSTTHKTLRGPRGGLILWNDDSLTKRINSGVFPGTQGGPLMNMVAAKAQAFAESGKREFEIYAHQVVDNARAMAAGFESAGVNVVTGGTDSHMLLLDLSDKNFSGKQLADELENNWNIVVNKNSIPNDPRNFVQTSGIRIGTAAETTRGMSVTRAIDIVYKIVEAMEGLEKS